MYRDNAFGNANDFQARYYMLVRDSKNNGETEQQI